MKPLGSATLREVARLKDEIQGLQLRLAAAMAELHDIVDNSPRSIARDRAEAALDSLQPPSEDCV